MMQLVTNVSDFSISCGGFHEQYNSRVFLSTDVPDTPESRQKILDLHVERHHLFDEFQKTPTDHRAKFRLLSKQLTELEYRLQDAWGFPQDPDFHTYWFQVPKCKCPKLDNRERFGRPDNIVRKDCPVHGD